MEAFVKSFATYRTIKKTTVISSALTLDSLEAETSTVTVVGTGVGRSNAGDWLIIDGMVYLIGIVKPQADRTLLTLKSPLDAFCRPLEFASQTQKQSVGNFVGSALQTNWVECSDSVYAMPYLTVSNSDTTPFIAPEVDGSGCFVLAEYCRLMRKGYRVRVSFADAGNILKCVIRKEPVSARQISFEDGRSQLNSVDYSSSGMAKLTVFCDVETGDTDDAGNPVLERQRSTWYLSESGAVSQNIPARRALGEWGTLSVKKTDEIPAKVVEAFAKNKANHKLEFWSTIDLAVQDDCTFWVYGESLTSYISYKRKSSEDKRYYYKSGELATTATEKLRGVVK